MLKNFMILCAVSLLALGGLALAGSPAYKATFTQTDGGLTMIPQAISPQQVYTIQCSAPACMRTCGSLTDGGCAPLTCTQDFQLPAQRGALSVDAGSLYPPIYATEFDSATDPYVNVAGVAVSPSCRLLLNKRNVPVVNLR